MTKEKPPIIIEVVSISDDGSYITLSATEYESGDSAEIVCKSDDSIREGIVAVLNSLCIAKQKQIMSTAAGFL